MNEPGPIEDGDKKWDRRVCNLEHWPLKLYTQLFAYIEPSLFGGAIQPTDSMTVLRQLMERCFGYNTGVVKGQTATKLKDLKRTKLEQFEVLRREYIANGRPLRTIEFEDQIVRWENKGNGIYKSFLADTLPPGQVPPTPVDTCGFCVMNTLTGKSVAVPALTCGTSNPSAFMDLVILLNHNESGAKYDIPKGVPLDIFQLFARANRGHCHHKTQRAVEQLAIEDVAYNGRGESPEKGPGSVGAHLPDASEEPPKKRITGKSNSNPESPGKTKLTASSSCKQVAEHVPPPPDKEDVKVKRKAAELRSEAVSTPNAKKKMTIEQMVSPSGSRSLRAMASDSSSEAVDKEKKEAASEQDS